MITNKIAEIATLIAMMSLDEKVKALNLCRQVLHEVSPFHNEPVDLVQWVKTETIEANNYNPNAVMPTEMRLLELSIEADGYTQPIVTMEVGAMRETIDGYHRGLCAKNCEPIRERIFGYAPVVTINAEREDKADRMAATIRHNRARGKHKVEAMSDIVMDLKRRNWNDTKIAKQLGMDADEVLRLAQITGLAEMFKDRDFSKAWDIEEITDTPTEITE